MLSAMDLEEFVSIDGRRCKDVIKTLNEPNRHANLSKFVSFRSKNQKTLEMDRIAQRTVVLRPLELKNGTRDMPRTKPINIHTALIETVRFR